MPMPPNSSATSKPRTVTVPLMPAMISAKTYNSILSVLPAWLSPSQKPLSSLSGRVQSLSAYWRMPVVS